MAGTRARLTISFASVLLGTMVVFAVALLAARRADASRQLAVEATRVADDVLSNIRAARAEGHVLTMLATVVDTLGTGLSRIRLAAGVSDRLDRHAGYFVVLDTADKVLYVSVGVRALAPQHRDRFIATAPELGAEARGRFLPIRWEAGRGQNDAPDRGMVLASRRDPRVGPNISRVVAGVPTDLADLSPRLFLRTMLIVAPVVVFLSLVLAYYIAGRAFRAVDDLINEVEDITDGRSLHRRLPGYGSNDEMARLSATVNAMLARLEHSFGGLRRFTADASHELKTPLAVLRADVERAMHPATSRTERMVALEEALQEVARMSDLVDSLLTLARADEGRFDLHRTPVDMEPLMREVYETAVILGGEAGLTLTLPQLDPAVVMGDRVRLRQLLLNLITNAIKYTPRGGRVELAAARRSPSELVITVRDTGIGISANDLPHVFERFWRADRARSRTSERGGFGLGMAIAHWIVQAHGGSIGLQSRLGRGTIFTIVLPTVPVAPEPGPEGADRAAPEAASREPAPEEDGPGAPDRAGISRDDMKS